MTNRPPNQQDNKLSKVDIDKEKGAVVEKIDQLVHDPANTSEQSLNDTNDDLSEGE